MPQSTLSKNSYITALRAGRVFSVTFEDEAVGAAPAQVEILVRVGSGAGILLGYAFAGGGDFWGALYDSPTLTDDGTTIPVVSRNRVNSIASSGSAFSGPTVSVDGTKLTRIFLNTGNRFNAIDPLDIEAFGWVLSPGDYLVQWENHGGTPTDASLELLWIDL